MLLMARAYQDYAQLFESDSFSRAELQQIVARRESQLCGHRTPVAIFHLYVLAAELSLVFDDLESAAAFLARAKPLERCAVGHANHVEFTFLQVLVCIEQRKRSHSAARLLQLFDLAVAMRRLYKWAQVCPENFDSYYRIARAAVVEGAGGSRATTVATRHYQAAATEARKANALRREALAHERAARLLPVGSEAARCSLAHARDAYLAFGATAKSAEIERTLATGF